MRVAFRETAFAPWTGLFAGAVLWALHHQVAGDLNFWDCRVGRPVLTIVIGLACALVALAAGWLSWWSRGAAEGRPETRAFAAFMGAAGAGLFLFAILLQTVAGVLVPGCHR